MVVRPAAPEHLAGIEAIYAVEVRESPTTFDLVAPGPEHWREVLAHTDDFVAAIADDGATVLGFAKTGRWRDRAAYEATVETSVYVARDARGAGVGHALYAELLARLDAGPKLQAIAGVTQPNEASMRLHRAHGFTDVGIFRAVGVKFERTWDVAFLQRALG